MTPEDLAKIRARLDATNDARMPHRDRDIKCLMLYANARRDLTVLLDHVAELQQLVQDLRDRAARSESPTAYAQIRPANHTMDLPKILVDEEGLRQSAGLRKVPPPVPKLDTGVSRQDALRVLSQLIDQIKEEK